MTDFTHHTPRLLSDADAAADLAGVARPSQGLRLLYDYGQAITTSGDSEEIYMHYAAAREYIKAMETERDEMASRVSELKVALREATDALDGGLWDYGPGQDEHTKCTQVVETCRAALNASKEHP